MKTALFILLFLTCLPGIQADPPEEGMWIPFLLKSLNEADMKSKGFQLSAEEIYSVNQSSMKDAVFSFGGFCTASALSDRGLLLTNHHCASGMVEALGGAMGKDFLSEGFWAMNPGMEIPVPGLTVSRIVRMEDVTHRVLAHVSPGMRDYQQQKAINLAIEEIEAEVETDSWLEGKVRPFFYGTEYYLIVTETFTDVRLAGIPPISIGRFGGDTDNWMWPRHTGDFALFRVYGDKDGNPSDYQLTNRPLDPGYHFPIRMDGAQEGEFTMVYGFPGETREYLSSYAIREIQETEIPLQLELLNSRIRRQTETGSTWNQTGNSGLRQLKNQQKKWESDLQGLAEMEVISQKQLLESQFQAWVEAQQDLPRTDRFLLKKLDQLYLRKRKSEKFRILLEEGMETLPTLSFTLEIRGILPHAFDHSDKKEALRSAGEQMSQIARSHFQKFNGPLDSSLIRDLIVIMGEQIPPSRQPEYFRGLRESFQRHPNRVMRKLWKNSIFTSEWKIQKYLSRLSPARAKRLLRDPIYRLVEDIATHYEKTEFRNLSRLDAELQELRKRYLLLRRRMESDRSFYPDANSTLRLSYGEISGVAAGKEEIPWFTTLDGLVRKYKPGDSEFHLPGRILELYASGNFGRYGSGGSVPVCFLATNHTSHGNSGSPVLDGRGRLLGTNFDRNLEGTASDLFYDPDRVRNISVDIRYILFIIDKFAGAGHLIGEMTLEN